MRYDIKMSTHDDYRKLLGREYSYLARSLLVKHGITTPESLRYFSEHLNSALPKTREDVLVSSVIKEIYYTNKFTFSRLPVGRGSGAEKYVLATDARNIARHFNLPRHVMLRWDNVNHLYVMGVAEPVQDEPVQDEPAHQEESETDMQE